MSASDAPSKWRTMLNAIPTTGRPTDQLVDGKVVTMPPRSLDDIKREIEIKQSNVASLQAQYARVLMDIAAVERSYQEACEALMAAQSRLVHATRELGIKCEVVQPPPLT